MTNSQNRYNNGNNLVRIDNGQNSTGDSDNNNADTIISVVDYDTDHDPRIPVYQGTKEETNPLQRSWALTIRLAPYTFTWLVLSIGIAVLANLNQATVFLIFSLLTSITYFIMDRQEREFSTNGVERFKISKLTELRKTELDYQLRLREIALRGILKQISSKDKGND